MRKTPGFRLRPTPGSSHFAAFLIVCVMYTMPGPTNVYGQQELENLQAWIDGIRVNLVEGGITYHREGTFAVESGSELVEGDLIKSEKAARAEILLQPGNFLRIGEETELRVLGDKYDRIRLQLIRGSISFEFLKHELDSGNFTDRLVSGYDLIRVATPDSEVLVLQPGISRINVRADGQTEVLVRKGEAVLNGHRVKEKRLAVVNGGMINVSERDSKLEDAFDSWCRTRADNLIKANRTLKKDAPWVKARKSGSEPVVDLPAAEKDGDNPYIVSARPGSITFAESGLEFTRDRQTWQKVMTSTELKSGDTLRSSEHAYAELSLLPDLHLRLDGATQLLLEQLSNEVIILKLLSGSLILDVPVFDRKRLPEMTLANRQTSVLVADSGNYRVDIKANAETITVRDGKVLAKAQSIGSCRKIINDRVADCGNKETDNFDWWSKHRGEGLFFTGRAMASRAARIRRNKSRQTGFWYQPSGFEYYTFVPFFSTYFQSPYGGNYAAVLSPGRRPMFMGQAPVRSSIRLPRLNSPVRQ
jgi:hypothetical protein